MPTWTTSQTNRACSGRTPERAAASSATVVAAARREPGERAERRAGRRQARPAVQRARAADVRLGGEHGERLAEIDVRRQLGDRRLPRLDLVDRRGRSEPVGKRLLAGFGPRGVEQLEQRGGPEEIEIARVGMAAEKSGAIRSASRPRAVEALEPALVEPSRAASALDRARARGRGRRPAPRTPTRREEPGRRHQLAAEGQPRDERRGAGGREPQVGDAEVRAFAVADDAVPALDSPLVLLTRGHRRRHRHRQNQVWIESRWRTSAT